MLLSHLKTYLKKELEVLRHWAIRRQNETESAFGSRDNLPKTSNSSAKGRHRPGFNHMRMAQIFDQIAEGVLAVDQNLLIRYTNVRFAEMVNSPPTQVFGRRLSEFVLPSEHSHLLRVLLAHTACRDGLVVSLTPTDAPSFPVRISLVFQDDDLTLGLLVRPLPEVNSRKESVPAGSKDAVHRHLHGDFKQTADVLFKEIHHRVKNNMQVISSILSLQAQELKDERTLEIFRECQNRVKSMALIHERLYQSSEFSQVDFGQYLGSLATHLLNSYQLKSQAVNLNVHADHIFLDMDSAIPCGLLVNELVSNAIKHAFPEFSYRQETTIRPEISINACSHGDGKMMLGVADNGIGIPERVDVFKANSLGLRLVRTLAEQLDAKINVSTSHGTQWIFIFSAAK